MTLDKNGQVIPGPIKRHIVIEVEVPDWSEDAWDEATAILESVEFTVCYMHGEVRVIRPSMSMTRGRERHVGWVAD